MSEHFAEIVGRDGRRRRARKGEILADGERFSLPMQFMDSQLHDQLVEKYSGGDAIRVVDAAGLPAGHRPGFLFDQNALGDSPGDVAYRERLVRLDANARKRCQPDDDDDEDNDARHRKTELERRQRLARKAAQETFGPDARQLTLDELEAAAAAAYEARSERMRNAWRSHHA
jgi:hypothetical protein